MYYGRLWTSVQDLETSINAYLDFYNTQRIKDSLGGHSISHYRALHQLEPTLS